MRDLRRSPFPEQKCPVCGARLFPGTTECGTCGTDLERAGLVLSTSVKPISRRSHVGVVRVIVKTISLVVLLSVLAIGLAQVPPVSARVPMLTVIASTATDALKRAWQWGSAFIPGSQSDRPGAAPAPPPSLPPATPSPTARGNPQPSSSPTQPPASPVLSLTVRSTPAGAQVQLNAKKVGTTPVTIKDVKPGTYEVKIIRSGYVPVSRTVQVQTGKPFTLDVTLVAATRSARRASVPPPQKPGTPGVRDRRLLEVGARAPTFVLKDRFGVLHNLSDFRGRGVQVLFVWSLDEHARRVIRELDLRMHIDRHAALVVVLNPDRIALRHFEAGTRVRVPLLFGSERIALAYGIPRDAPVLYVISERGLVERRTRL